MPALTNEEYRNLLMACHSIVAIGNKVSPSVLEEAISMAEKMDTLGPFADPTLYREKGRALRQDIEIMRAVLTLVKAAKKIKRTGGGRLST